MPAAQKSRTNDALEAERRYVKDRPLTEGIKKSFPSKLNIDGLTSYIEKNLKRERLRTCMNEFCIPAEAEANATKFSRALALQFYKFVRSDADEIENSVWEFYQLLLRNEKIDESEWRCPLYPGDDVFVDIQGRTHQAECYEIIHHVWRIKNRGNQEWHDRRLVLKNGNKIHPRPRETIIPVHDLLPGKYIKISTDIDARGFEGNFECEWEMQDKDGKNCFPNHKWDFNVIIQVEFGREDGGMNSE